MKKYAFRAIKCPLNIDPPTGGDHIFCVYKIEGHLPMRVEPKIRNNICITAHPTGCAQQVKEQIQVVASRPAVEGPNRVLVVGASNGYGLAARIVAAFPSFRSVGILSRETPTVSA